MAAQRLEQERTRTRSVGEHVQDASVGLLQGAVGLGQVGYGLTNMLTGGFLDRGLDFADNFRETQQTLDGWKSDPLQLRKQHMMETFDNQGIGAGVLEAITNPTLIADMAISNAAQLLPGAALASRASCSSTQRVASSLRSILPLGLRGSGPRIGCTPCGTM